MTAVADNLIRRRFGGDAIRTAAEPDSRALHGHFAVFEEWTEIHSRREGRFMERLVPGSFDKPFKNPDQVRVMYDHGQDGYIGQKPIAVPGDLRQDDIGAAYETEMLDASYALDLLPAARAGQLGASFRFGVEDDEWVTPKKETKRNPEKLRERTIRAVFPLYEYGPTPWGAYPTATTGVRSGTDEFYDHLTGDPLFLARFTDMVGVNVIERILENAPGDSRADPSGVSDVVHSLPTHLLWRAKRLLHNPG